MSVCLQADTLGNWITFADVFKSGNRIEIRYHQENFKTLLPVSHELQMAREWANFLTSTSNGDGAYQIDIKVEEIPGNGSTITQMWLRRLIVD